MTFLLRSFLALLRVDSEEGFCMALYICRLVAPLASVPIICPQRVAQLCET